MSQHSNDVTVLAHYNVILGKEAEFEEALREHRAGLEESDLIDSAVATQIFRIREEAGTSLYVEIFDWKSPESPGVAHNHPIIEPLWSKMGALCEERGADGLRFRFPHAKRLA